MILFCLLSIYMPSNIKADTFLFNGRKIEQAYWKGIQIEYVEGQIAIKKTSGSSTDKVIDALRKLNLQETKSFDKLGIGLFSVPKNTSIFPIIEALENDPLIEWAEPNMVDHAAILPNDEYFNQQWGLHNTGQSPPGGTSDADIDAPEGWDIETGSSTIILGILDSGIPLNNLGNLSHPDLDDATRIILGSDFVGDGNWVKDENGHGTHVAGIAAAETNNDTGVAGVGWNCKLRIVQVFDKNGTGSHQQFKDGVIECVDNGCKVINYSGSGSESFIKREAVEYAESNGCLIVACTGNNGPEVEYPAAYSKEFSNVIAVGATDHNDSIASYSNSGPELTVVAPGGYGGATLDEDDIYSTTPNYSFELESIGVTQNYGYLCGTSMATPHVAGLAALILSQHPDWSPELVRYAIEIGADDLGESGWDEEYGWGRINAHGSLTFTIETDLVLQNITVGPGETHRYLAFNSIQAAGKDDAYEDTYFIIKDGGNCTMEAGNEIRLKPGFEARTGCEFASSINSSLNPTLQINLSELLSTKNPSLDLTEETKETEAIPTVFSCAQNYPNPFNVNTTIKYGLPKSSKVLLEIYNLAGQKVRTLVDANESAGYKTASWDGRTSSGKEVPQGIYFYVFKAGDYTKNYKMIVVK